MANSAHEKKKRKNIKNREGTQGETAGEEEADWEKAGKEKREDTQERGTGGEKESAGQGQFRARLARAGNGCSGRR